MFARAAGTVTVVLALGSNAPPASADPPWVEAMVLQLHDGERLGYSFSLSSGYLAIGAPYSDVAGHAQAGRVWIYHQSGGSWVFDAAANDPALQSMALFGWAVAVTSGIDGAWLVVGAPEWDHTSPTVAAVGRVRFFRRDPGTGIWQPEAAFEGVLAGERLGTAVAASGARAAFAAPAYAAQQGRVHTVKFQGGAVTTFETVSLSGGLPGDRFGTSVGIVDNMLGGGDYLAVGAPYLTPSGGAIDAGAVFVYEPLSGGGWALQQTLVAPGAGPLDHHGASLSVNASRIVAGAPGREVAGGLSDAGTALVWRRGAFSWYLEDEAFPTPAQTGSQYGAAVALDPAGAGLVVGAPQLDTFLWTLAGAGVFHEPRETVAGTAWLGRGRLVGIGSGGQLGFAVGLDGDWAVLAAPFSANPIANSGTVFVFQRDVLFADGFD